MYIIPKSANYQIILKRRQGKFLPSAVVKKEKLPSLQAGNTGRYPFIHDVYAVTSEQHYHPTPL